MDIKEAIIKRHSVRRYLDKEIEADIVNGLNSVISDVCVESGLDIKLVLNEPNAFTGFLAKYGKFENCKNYITVCGKGGREVDVGYYGEKIVIAAQMLGLNTCWVALTYKKGCVPVKAKDKEKFYITIAVGYGRNRGLPRKTKPMEKLCNVPINDMPEWFKNGMDFAMRAPTAINQQKFFIKLISAEDRIVSASSKIGPCSKIDLGIVKYHFEIGAGKESFKWKE
ncbi:MAG: nitroreductase [Clostridia bacterium]|nr:nitroreductase [Clostridia bacterium]